MTAEEKLLENGYEETIFLTDDSYDDALIGVSSDGRAIYDFDLMVKWLVDRDGMTDDEAIEWIEYNTERALPYAGEGANNPLSVLGINWSLPKGWLYFFIKCKKKY